jgi:glucosamine-6-phosphate deaminase
LAHDISQVPKRAISMSPRQILKAKELIVIVPDRRKAQAVKACLEGEITPMVPASILRTHPNATLYLDRESASVLSSTSAGKIHRSDGGSSLQMS